MYKKIFASFFGLCFVRVPGMKAFHGSVAKKSWINYPSEGRFWGRIKEASSHSYGTVRTRPLGMLFNIFGEPPKQEANYYSTLQGAAREQAEAALSNMVPSLSKDGYRIATFAGGCFWGLELMFQRIPGVVETSVGYTQGEISKPTYSAVCSGTTGHTEAVQVYYKPDEVQFADLCEAFFERTDPTQVNGQGNDWGTQYRTGIYYHTDDQKEEAAAVFEKVKARYRSPIATELKPATLYWPAEKYHQQYLEKGGRMGMAQSAAKGCKDSIRCYG